MNRKHTAGARTNTEKTLHDLSGREHAPWKGLIFLMVLYIVVGILVIKTSHSDGSIVLAGRGIPYRSLTGALSSVANLCLIFLVVYYKKQGFILSLTFLVAQMPMLLVELVVRHNFTGIAGVFTNLLIIIAIVMLDRNEENIKAYQLRLGKQATTDALTELPNRFACSELMKNLVSRGVPFTVVVLNLSGFKNINSTMGESTGDAILKKLAERWTDIADRGAAGTLDFVTRQGGDEFAIIIRNYATEDDILRTLLYYESAMKRDFTVDGCDFYLTASAGYAMYPNDGDSAETLLTCANLALAEARKTGGELTCRYSTELPTAGHAMETERKIRSALEEGRLFFQLQPQYDISHRLSGFEALARIREEDGKMLSPGEFIPVAERTGLIDRIDHTVFRDAAHFFGELIEKTHTGITLSFNVSVKYLMKTGFIEEIREILDTCGVPAEQLEVEITESVMIDSMEKALQRINQLKKMGFKIAIDDFGTGYSSLSYLSSFPADTLKVDKSFIDKMNLSNASKQYVAAIISIGHLMGFDVICEGVEDEEQLSALREIGCDHVQGFFWGRPMLPEAAGKLVTE